MKFLFGAARTQRLYFTISYNLTTQVYKRNYSLVKKAFVTFLGIPIYSTKCIAVEIHDDEVVRNL